MRILTIVRVGKKATVTYVTDARVIGVREFDSEMSRSDIERAIISSLSTPAQSVRPAVRPVVPPVLNSNPNPPINPNDPPGTAQKAKRTAGRKIKGAAGK